MAVKLRLSRHGTTNAPFYWLVAADSRFARDSRYLEKLGTYNPLLIKENPERLKLNKERIEYWLSVGATPSERTIKLLGLIGIKGLDKFINKNKSTIGTPKTTKNPDKRGGTKTSESTEQKTDDKSNVENKVETPAAEKQTDTAPPSNEEVAEKQPNSEKDVAVSTEETEKQNETKNSDTTQSE